MDLPKGELAEAVVSGSGFKPYVMFAVTEGSEAASEIPVDGVRGLKRATDIHTSNSAKGVDDRQGGTKAEWEGETFSLYVKDPVTAQLVMTVMEDARLKEDQIIGGWGGSGLKGHVRDCGKGQRAARK